MLQTSYANTVRRLRLENHEFGANLGYRPSLKRRGGDGGREKGEEEQRNMGEESSSGASGVDKEGDICMCAEHRMGRREGPTQDSAVGGWYTLGLLGVCEADIGRWRLAGRLFVPSERLSPRSLQHPNLWRRQQDMTLRNGPLLIGNLCPYLRPIHPTTALGCLFLNRFGKSCVSKSLVSPRSLSIHPLVSVIAGLWVNLEVLVSLSTFPHKKAFHFYLVL